MAQPLIDYSNAKYNEDGTINCIWHHPVHGDIPFTASAEDVEPHGVAIFNFLKDKADPYQPTSNGE